MEKEKVKELLTEEIVEEIESLSELPYGTQEHSEAIGNIDKLCRIKVEMDKIEKDAKEKRVQLEEAKKDRWIKIGLTTMEVILPLGFYGIWMRKGFKFEETGAFTSTTFKGLINRFRPTGK